MILRCILFRTPVNELGDTMAYSSWDALKDFLGALGPILIAIPWFRDFSLRKTAAAMGDVQADGTLARLRERIEQSLRKKIEVPRMSDFVWTVVGLLCIFSSFLIALVHGILERIDP